MDGIGVIISLITAIICGLMIFLVNVPMSNFPVPGGHVTGFWIVGILGIIISIVSTFISIGPLGMVFKVLKWVFLIGGIAYLGFVFYTYSPSMITITDFLSFGGEKAAEDAKTDVENTDEAQEFTKKTNLLFDILKSLGLAE